MTTIPVAYPVAASAGEEEATELLSLDAVQCYQLRDNTKLLLDTAALRVISVGDDDEQVMLMLGPGDAPSTLIQLRVDIPCVRVAPRNYVFPQLDRCLGVVLPTSASWEEVEVFEHLLDMYSSLRVVAEDENDAHAGLGAAAEALAFPLAMETEMDPDDDMVVGSVHCEPSAAPAAADADVDMDMEQHLQEQEQLVVEEEFDWAHEGDESLVLSFDSARIYRIERETRLLLECGPLRVTVSPSGDEYVLSVNGYRLQLTPKLPCIRTAPFNYIFPLANYSLGLVVDCGHGGVESAAENEELQALEVCLAEQFAFRVAPEAAARPIDSMQEVFDRIAMFGQNVSRTIHLGSTAVAQGLIKGSQMLGRGLERGVDYVKQRVLTKHTEPVRVDPVLQGRLAQASVMSGTVVKVSKAVVAGAVATASALSEQISDRVSGTRVGKRIRAKGGPRSSAAKQVAKSSLGALFTVYEALETAGLTLIGSVGNATVGVVQHSYGDEAGQAARQGVNVITDLSTSMMQMRRLGVRALAKRTAQITAADVVADDDERAELRARRPRIDPATGVQAVLALDQVANAIQRPPQPRQQEHEEELT